MSKRAAFSALLLLAALSIAGCKTAAMDLKVGDCFDGAPANTEVSEVDSKPCTEPHENEVFAVFDYPGSATEHPGDAALDAAADTGCVDAFRQYVGKAIEDSSLTFSYLVPTQASWRLGDRAITCLIEDPSGAKLTGSMQGSAR